jgi:hypothetical protein
MYKIDNEPELTFSMLVTADGNQSLRLVDSTFLAGDLRPDGRVLTSSRWISPEEVDIYKDEVRSRKKALHDSGEADLVADGDCLDEIGNLEDTGDDSDESSAKVAGCVQRWRNAGPEARKKMFALFAITGIFLVVCRHGHVLVMCDMIRSGEL